MYIWDYNSNQQATKRPTGVFEKRKWMGGLERGLWERAGYTG